jgi:hypothetical protein
MALTGTSFVVRGHGTDSSCVVDDEHRRTHGGVREASLA